MRGKKILQNTFIQLIGRAGVVLLTFISTIVLTRHLGPALFGDYTFLTSFWLFLVSLSDWGTQIIGVREISRQKTLAAKKQVLASLRRLRLYLLAGGLTAGLLGLLLPLFGRLRLLALLSLLAVIFTNWQINSFVVFQAFLRFGWQATVEIGGAFFFLLFLLINFSRQGGLGGVLLALVASRLLMWLMAGFKARGLIGGGKVSQSQLHFLWQQALPTGALLFVNTAYDRLVDTSLLLHWQGSAAVGIYGLAYKIYANLILPAYFFNRSLFPLLSRRLREKKQFWPLFKLGIVWSLKAVLPLAVAAWWGAGWLIRILGGESFAAAVGVLRWLILALPFVYLNHVFGFSLIAARYQWQSLLISLVALAWNLVGNWWFIPRFSVLGAAGVTLITEILVCLLSGWTLWRIFPRQDDILRKNGKKK